MITFPCSKINLGLDIVSKRPDGYHNLETVFYPIPLEDALEITVNDRPDAPDCTFTMHNACFGGSDEDNLVVKAYRILAADHQLPKVEISLYKNIPTGAGLGGGSSDAAFALKMLNTIGSLNLSDEQLEEYAARIGADCAFFIRCTPSLATGIGNILTPVECPLQGYHLVLVKPDVSVSTKEAYEAFDTCTDIRHPDCSAMLHAAANADFDGILSNVGNVFEQFIEVPQRAEIKAVMRECGSLACCMSGSGPTVFGIFDSEEKAKECVAAIPEKLGKAFLTRPI